tara:strand:- start:5 stop:703 length:699 start_codon:yes stop_codon:yes gene_type:complete
MEKYFQFQARPEASRPPMFQLVNMSNVKYLWVKDDNQLFFISNSIDNSAGLVLTGSLENSAGYIKAYLEREWQQLINSNDKIRVIPSVIPVTVPGEKEDCELNTWEAWELTAGFDPENCNILNVEINPEGLGSITIGSPFVIESFSGFYAQAEGTPCGTQDIAFLTGVGECQPNGVPVGIPGLEEYLFTGAKVLCEIEGGEAVQYCLIAKPVSTIGPGGNPTINLSIAQVLR